MKAASSILLAFLIWSLAIPSWALIAVSAAKVDSTTTSSVTSHTTAVTVDATTKVLLVCVSNSGTTAGGPSGVTYDGSAMTASQSTAWTTADEGTASFWYTVNPAVTTANVVVSWSASTKTNLGTGNTIMQYSGVDTAALIDAQGGSSFNTGGATTITHTTTTVADNAWLVDCVNKRVNSAITMVVQDGRTGVTNRSLSNSVAASSYRSAGAPNNYTMDWTLSANRGAISVVSLKPSVESSACNGSLMLMGAGGC